MRAFRLLVATALALVARGAQAQSRDDAVYRAMRDELARSMARLRLDTMPQPYFIAYRVDELEYADVDATLGSLVRSDEARQRRLSVELRVGDYAFDNTNFMGGTGRSFGFVRGGFRGMGGDLSLDDNYVELRRQLWLATDGAYKGAVEALANKRAALQSRAGGNSVPDFSHEEVATISDVVSAPPADRMAAENLVRQLSGIFRDRPEIQRSGVGWNAGVVRTWYLNSEGTSFTRASPGTTVRIVGSAQATDGMMLGDYVELHSPGTSGLPTAAALADSVRAMAGRLGRLRAAPSAEVYQGPVLFEGEASAELFAYLFAPQLAASRVPVSDNPMFEQFASRQGSSFLDRIGTRVLPRFMTVTDNPALGSFEGRALGGYRVDDDGVPARETKLVDHGMLRTLVTTRVPVRDLRRSTGNRSGDGANVTNVIVTVDSGLSAAALRRRLLELAAANGNGYAIVVRRIAVHAAMAQDPFSFMMFGADEGEAALPAALVLKLYPDGREEPIRGAQLEGIRPGSFRDIIAASAARTLYTTSEGGAEGSRMMRMRGFGWVGPTPTVTSYIVPSILFEEVTIRSQSGRTLTPPVISPPWGRR